VLSAPVKDVKTGKWHGFLDVRDLVAYVVLSYEFEQRAEREAREGQAILAKHADDVHDKEFLTTILHSLHSAEPAHVPEPQKSLTVSYLSGRNKFLPVFDNEPLTKATEFLSRSDVHRVPVLNKSRELLDIVSQSTIVEFMQKHPAELKAGLSKTLEELGLAHKPVVAVRDNESALNTFRLLNQKCLSGVAVVDKDGKIVGNTSASDLKLFIRKPSFRLLKMPVFEYLNIIRRESIREGVPVVTVHADDTLEKAVGKLAATGMHRIFVVDDKMHPVGVVSVTDIVRKCLGFVEGTPTPRSRSSSAEKKE